MKTLGLIGGLSWHSTIIYYRIINQIINERLGELNSAKIILNSVNHQEFRVFQEEDNWQAIGKKLSDIAVQLENDGADCIVMCCNTTHNSANDIIDRINIPFIHIADETAKEIAAQKISKVGLLGTKFTMENPFFKDRMLKFGIETIVPESRDRDIVFESIFKELAFGIVKDDTRIKFINIINKLRSQGAEGIILGCTEIPLLISDCDSPVKVFDTTSIHAKAAAEFALS
ncbi:aspartate/glutamate racemase family protein [soil metagenome]